MRLTCLQTISNYLDGAHITYKIARRSPEGRNAAVTKQLRLKYAKWFLSNHPVSHIYIDETGVCLWTARGRGRAPRGVTPAVLVSSQQGANRSVVMAKETRNPFSLKIMTIQTTLRQ